MLQTNTENVRGLFGQKARRMHDGKHGKPVFTGQPTFRAATVMRDVVALIAAASTDKTPQ